MWHNVFCQCNWTLSGHIQCDVLGTSSQCMIDACVCMSSTHSWLVMFIVVSLCCCHVYWWCQCLWLQCLECVRIITVLIAVQHMFYISVVITWFCLNNLIACIYTYIYIYMLWCHQTVIEQNKHKHNDVWNTLCLPSHDDVSGTSQFVCVVLYIHIYWLCCRLCISVTRVGIRTTLSVECVVLAVCVARLCLIKSWLMCVYMLHNVNWLLWYCENVFEITQQFV